MQVALSYRHLFKFIYSKKVFSLSAIFLISYLTVQDILCELFVRNFTSIPQTNITIFSEVHRNKHTLNHGHSTDKLETYLYN